MGVIQFIQGMSHQFLPRSDNRLDLANKETKTIGRRQVAASFVPPSIVAGSVNVASGSDPAHVAYNSACLALDSERVCLIFSTHDRMVHYIAGLASDFSSSSPNVATMLATSLPGMAHHEGDGCYQANLDLAGDIVACVACKDGRVYSFVGTPSRAERFPAAIGGLALPLIKISDSDDRIQDIPVWKPHSEREREDNKRLLRLSGIFLFAVNVVMGLIWVASSITQGISESKLNDITGEATRSMTSLVNAMAPASYKHEAWNEYQSVASFAMDHKGKMEHFELKDGQIAWSMSVPIFVTGGEINHAFKGVTVTESGDKILIKKGGIK